MSLFKRFIYRVFVPWFVACASVYGDTSSPIEVVDQLGNSVRLAEPAKRIVALAPHAVENLFSAGLGDKIVGVVEFSDFPKEAKGIPRVGSSFSFSFERILALSPDLVVVWASAGGQKVIGKFRELGLPVYVSAPHSFDDIAKSVRDFGILGGTQAKAERSAVAFERQLSALTARYSAVDEIAVFYQIWHDPLQTVNGRHIISRVLGLCGGANVFANEGPIAPKVSVESVLMKDPQAIITSGMAKERPEWLNDWRLWSGLSAVKHDGLFSVPPDLIQRHTFRVVQGAEIICDQLDSIRRK